MYRRWLLLSLVLLLSVPTLTAASICDSDHDGLLLALSEARLPQGTQQKIVTKVQNARRQSKSSAPNSRSNAIKQLEQALQLLDSNATRDVAADTRTKLRSAITAYASCLSSAPALQSVPVTVRVKQVGDTAGTTVPAGANVEIRLDGETAGKTKPDGTATLTVTLGDHSFAAVAAADYGALLRVEVTQATQTLDLVMNGGADFAVRAQLQIDELADHVLQPTFKTFTARFLDAEGNTVKLKTLSRFELTSTGGELTDLRPSIALKNGEMASTDVAALRQILNDRFGPYELVVSGADNDSRVYRNKITFDLGRHRASGAVTSPASVAVPLAGIPVRLTNDRNGFVFWATTAANGTLTLPALLPEGVYLVYCNTVHQSIRYFCADAFVLNADRNFSLRLFALAGPAAEPMALSTSTGGR